MRKADQKEPPAWGPFGRPLFQDPSARALARVGVVDVGSNSVRLVVFDGAARSPAYFYNEKILCGLGKGFHDTGALNPDGRRRALAAIKRFQLLAQAMGLPQLTAVATAAVREASDGAEFRADVLRETGLKLWVINGEEEARLSAQGVLLGWPGADGLLCDIGGSSMELAVIRDGAVGKRMTAPLGPLRLEGIAGGRKGRKAEIDRNLDILVDALGTGHKRLFLVGGSWRAIARLDMERRGYPLHVLHEYRMTPRSVTATVDWIAKVDLEVVRQSTQTSAERMSLVPLASEVLRRTVRRLKPKEIAISAYGIREGMLYEQMPGRLRRRDPLIEACRFAEAKDARIPGFGRALFTFLQPLYRNARPARQRIVKAACLLHDVTWRAHPDYRHEVCFDNATRANLGGLTHSERVFLGLALLHRYKNSRQGTRFEPMIDLLTPEQLADAETLGKAMRFGAMFSVQDSSLMGQLVWRSKKRELEMRVPAASGALFGEVAAARFDSLCAALNAQGSVTFLE